MSILDPLAYPQPRVDRSPGTSFVQPPPGATAATPRTRVIAIRVANSAANTRATASAGPFTGPALLKHVRLEINANVAGAGATFQIGVSPTRITEVGVALNAAKGWRPLVEQVLSDVTVPPASNEGFWQTESPATALAQGGDTSIVILDPTFFLTFTAFASAAAGFRWVGNATLLEGVSEEALRNFL